MGKRIISWILSLCMLFSLIPSSVFAADENTIPEQTVTQTQEETQNDENR